MTRLLVLRHPVRVVVLLLLWAISGLSPCMAQGPSFAAGDRVMVDTNMASDPAYQKWQPATVTQVHMWQGQVSGITVRTDGGLELTTSENHLQAGATAPPPAAATAAPAASPPTATEAPVPAADPGTGNCTVGTRVVDREGRVGTVVRATGPSCHVRFERSGEEDYFLQWMLKPADQEDAGARAALQAGTYDCWAASGAAGNLKLVILDARRYSNGDGDEGAYSYDPATGAIAWQTGPWAGFYGSWLEKGRIGISSRPGGFSSTTCDLE